MSDNFKKIGDIIKLGSNRPNRPKPPAYAWQDFALWVIKELNIPDFKRSAVFKICKELPKVRVEQCVGDTKELCQTGAKWKYFFKIIGNLNKSPD